MIKIIFTLLTSLTAVASYTQSTFNELDMEQIPQKKIRHFIDTQKENKVVKFSDIEPSFTEGMDLNGYCLLESSYLIKENLNRVWNRYKSVSPAESWNGKMISFGLLISKWTNSVIYRDQNTFAGIDTGQVFLVNLRILKGIYNLAVGLEIINIDSLSRTIKFSYVKGNKSQGEQTIHFVSTDNGYTRVIHSTAFKSNSSFRDRHLYPFFHYKAITEFHRNIMHTLLFEDKNLNRKRQRT